MRVEVEGELNTAVQCARSHFTVVHKSLRLQ